LTFKIYDCDGDSKITKNDVRQILAFVPIFKPIDQTNGEENGNDMALEVKNPTTEEIVR